MRKQYKAETKTPSHSQPLRSSACTHLRVIGITVIVFRRNIDYSDRWQTISPAWHSKKHIAFWGPFLLVPLGVLLPLRALARRLTCAFLL